jgi:hypothetical protein
MMSMFYSFLLCFSMMMPSRKSTPTTTNNSTQWLKRTTSLFVAFRVCFLSLSLERSALFNLETQREKRFLSL